MELSKAKEVLTDLIKSYSQKITDTGAKCKADVYFTDEKGLATSLEMDEISDALCGSITVSVDDAKDENDKCGFDLLLQLTKSRDIDDREMENAISEFKTDLDSFVNELSEAEDKDAFIREQSEKEKAEYSEKMEKFNKDMKKLQMFSICLFGVVMLLVLAGIFALVSSL